MAALVFWRPVHDSCRVAMVEPLVSYLESHGSLAAAGQTGGMTRGNQLRLLKMHAYPFAGHAMHLRVLALGYARTEVPVKPRYKNVENQRHYREYIEIF
jgi:hypothetical protein